MSDVVQFVFDEKSRAKLARAKSQLSAQERLLAVRVADIQEKTKNRAKMTRSEYSPFYELSETRDAIHAIELRLSVPFATGPQPSDSDAKWRMYRDRIIRAEWECYFDAAQTVGMFSGEQGSNLLKALRSSKIREFKSAIAECMVCWILAGRYRYRLKPYVETSGKKDVEFLATTPDLSAFTEVKAPYKAVPNGLFRSIGPYKRIAGAVLRASEKFVAGHTNVVFVVPAIDGIFNEADERRAYFEAVYGRSAIAWSVNKVTGMPGPTEVVFQRDGRFLKGRKNGRPAHTRVSGLVGVSRVIRGDIEAGDAWVDHRLLVLENPNAVVGLDKSFLSDAPRLTVVEGQLCWSDGYEIDA